MDPAWIALISTAITGVGLKVAEKLLSKGQVKQDAATAMREELRKESAALKEEVRQIEKELDTWKEKYFALLQQYLELKSQLGQPIDKKPGEDW